MEDELETLLQVSEEEMDLFLASLWHDVEPDPESEDIDDIDALYARVEVLYCGTGRSNVG